MREHALQQLPTTMRGALALLALTALALLAGTAAAQASTGDIPTRGEPQAPPHPGGTLKQLNPQPEPPGAAATPPGGPADGQCAGCEPPTPGDPGPQQNPWKPYELEIKKVWVCDTEDSAVDEIYIRINGVKVWGIWGLNNDLPGTYCKGYGLYHREALLAFTGWATIDLFDEDWPDPDDWLLNRTVYTTSNPAGWTGTMQGKGSNYNYWIDYEVRPRPPGV